MSMAASTSPANEADRSDGRRQAQIRTVPRRPWPGRARAGLRVAAPALGVAGAPAWAHDGQDTRPGAATVYSQFDRLSGNLLGLGANAIGAGWRHGVDVGGSEDMVGQVAVVDCAGQLQ